MANQAPFYFYYTSNLPARSVPIAYLSTPAATPAQLTSVNNSSPIVLPGTLTAQQYLGDVTFTAPDLNVPLTISGSNIYIVGDQFFLITDQINGQTPLFYSHLLPSAVSNVTLLDTDGNVYTDFVVRQIDRDGVVGNYLLHNYATPVMTVRYVGSNGFVYNQLLQHVPVIQWSPVAVTSTQYTLVGGVLSLQTTGIYYIQFTSQSGYQILPPFDDLPNVPWYARIRFGLQPVAPEWANQNWLPVLPYILGTWIAGTAVGSNFISFERAPIYWDGVHYPNILVYDQKYNLKYALSGEEVTGQGTQLGYEFPWALGQIQDIDPQIGTVKVAVALDATDIIFGFYSYYEPDVVYRYLDINPATNPAVRNMEVQFIYDSSTPTRAIYHQIINPNGPPPIPLTDTQQSIGYLMVGTSISTSQYTITDSRARGGGLAPNFQNIPQTMDFWDLGYWDGKPFPIGGTLIVYLPLAIQSQYTTAQLQAKIQAILPMGVLAVIRYYDQNGNESA